MKFSAVRKLAICATLLLSAAYAAGVSAATGYHLVKSVPLGAAPGGGEYFDYITVDSAARRVYLSHGTEVKIVNADTAEVVGTIGGFERCHCLALFPSLNSFFITDGDASLVFVLDLHTLKVPADI